MACSLGQMGGSMMGAGKEVNNMGLGYIQAVKMKSNVGFGSKEGGRGG